MDRLTENINGDAVSTTYDEDFIFAMDDKTYDAYSETIKRLADYEDTGLTPDEVVNLEKLFDMRNEQVAKLIAKIERLQKIIENAKYILGKEDEING